MRLKDVRNFLLLVFFATVIIAINTKVLGYIFLYESIETDSFVTAMFQIAIALNGYQTYYQCDIANAINLITGRCSF